MGNTRRGRHTESLNGKGGQSHQAERGTREGGGKAGWAKWAKAVEGRSIRDRGRGRGKLGRFRWMFYLR